MKVTFVVNGTTFQVEARVPEEQTLSKEDVKHVIINNAVNDIKNTMCIDMASLLDDVYAEAIIESV